MNKLKTILFISIITFVIYACSKDEDAINNDSNVIIPTWFSPDGDGFKDSWKIEDPLSLIDKDQFSAKIYDTAHKLVFLTLDISKPWLGTKSDSTIACDTGSYYFAVQYRSWTGISRFRTGNVFLSRKKP